MQNTTLKGKSVTNFIIVDDMDDTTAPAPLKKT